MLINRFYLELLLLVSVPAAIGGCAHQAMDYSVASWQNQQVSAVIAAWGKPSEELHVDGKHLMLWNTDAGNSAAPEQKSPSARPKGCVRLLRVDSSGKVVAGNWEGNDCPGWFSGWYR